MRLVPFLPVISWAALIFLLSSFPNPPGSTGNEWQSNLAHVTEYAILTVLLFWAVRSARPSLPAAAVAVVGWLVCVAYGVSDEYHQSFVVNRDSNVLDVGFDAMGSAFATIVLLTISFKKAPKTS